MLQPFFPYFGGKWRITRQYPAPHHTTIIEPFAGSAGYSLYHPSKKIILVEKNKSIADMWHYLINATEDQIQALPLIVEHTTDELDVDPSAKTLIGSWLGVGAGGAVKMPSKWAQSGTRPNCFWGEQIRNRIARQVTQIKHWQIISGDYSLAPNLEATWFIDPPYQNAGKVYKESARQLNFVTLGNWCQTRNGQIIVCENVGATWLPFVPYLTTQASGGNNRNRLSHEAIWTNTKIGFFS